MASGRVGKLFLKIASGQPMREVAQATAIAGQGLQGDASFGKPQRQILLVGEETLIRFDLRPGDLRENITVTGLPLASLMEGTRLQVGEALVVVTGDCEPCEHMDALRPGLQEAIRGQRGILARVVSGGLIRLGDAISTMPSGAADEE